MARLRLKRQTTQRRKRVLEWGSSVFCFSAGLFLIVLSLILCQNYRIRSARAVTVDAVVTSIEEYEVDLSTNYRVCISYTYNGSEYTTRYLTSSNEKWRNSMGMSVKFLIDSEDPGTGIDGLTDGLFFAFFFGMPLFASGFLTIRLPGRKTKEEEYRRIPLWVPLLVYALGMIIWGIYIADIDGIFAGSIALGCMVMPFSVILLVRDIINSKQTKVNS